MTSFLFRSHPVSTVFAGPTLWDLDKAPEVMRWYRELVAQAPDDLNGFFTFRRRARRPSRRAASAVGHEIAATRPSGHTAGPVAEGSSLPN